ncbi:hypothetical protein HMI54_003883 [Coelomomyces lativittatus]|nr:hypothetical protein HMI56_002638 [Coelomomyces lativittatus]KAJ1517813.1 hypothetical protein HMI54_003883 [Coelomomyces lativittatus]KAJ1518030.1 hypothetical protein HMI55_003804 [Coelomomyces lativittatus]
MFSGNKKKGFFSRIQQQTISVSGHEPIFRHRLNFYVRPPEHEISIEEFESFALARLKLLKALETASLKSKTEDDLKLTLTEAEATYMPLHPNNADIARLDEERSKDHVSHFILKLAYAKNESLRNWFAKYETLLFRLRLEREVSSERSQFLRDLKIKMEELSSAEKHQYSNELSITTGISDIDAEVFYKVHWTRLLDLVSRRKCLVKNGYAFISNKDTLGLVVNEFKAHLLKQLELTSRYLPRMDEDERLLPVLNNMSNQYLGKPQFNASSGKLTADDIDMLSQHFPLCMRNLHDSLKKEGHLRNGGRMQYGLFLKGIGLPVDEALTFWQRMFRKFTPEQFQKNYAYHIRYNYGLEGKRSNYAPYHCTKIITTNAPSTGDHHGCPFKHFSNDRLRQLLHVHASPSLEKEIPSIMDLARQGHYQLACSKYFEVTVQPMKNEQIEHPNHYFILSRQYSGTSNESVSSS